MRQLAFELYEWWQTKLHAQALFDQRLDDTDVKLLQRKQQGYTTTQICNDLGYAESMVNTRLRRIYDKLEVTNIKGAIARAIQLDILPG